MGVVRTSPARAPHPRAPGRARERRRTRPAAPRRHLYSAHPDVSHARMGPAVRRHLARGQAGLPRALRAGEAPASHRTRRGDVLPLRADHPALWPYVFARAGVHSSPTRAAKKLSAMALGSQSPRPSPSTAPRRTGGGVQPLRERCVSTALVAVMDDRAIPKRSSGERFTPDTRGWPPNALPSSRPSAEFSIRRFGTDGIMDSSVAGIGAADWNAEVLDPHG